jgi:hypothetical protein
LALNKLLTLRPRSRDEIFSEKRHDSEQNESAGYDKKLFNPQVIHERMKNERRGELPKKEGTCEMRGRFYPFGAMGFA